MAETREFARIAARLRRWSVLAAFALLTIAAAAAPLSVDLGDGLRYHRAATLPADLPPAGGPSTALILDLRYAAADEPAATAFAGWLRFRTRDMAPVFLLVNRDTAVALRAVLAAQPDAAGVVTIGTAVSGFAPDIAIDVNPEAERRAYDALSTPGQLATLIAPPIDKPRTDEATIMRQRANLPEERPGDNGEEPLLTDASPGADDTRPPVDRTLQRAVQLHRALRALQRI